MRKKLKQMNEQRKTFTGQFVRYGTKPAWNSPTPDRTMLLSNITDIQTGEIVTDHLWFNLTKGFSGLGDLTEGTLVQFDARVKVYTKGYVNHRLMIDEKRHDYKLSHPTKIKAVVPA